MTVPDASTGRAEAGGLGGDEAVLAAGLTAIGIPVTRRYQLCSYSALTAHADPPHPHLALVFGLAQTADQVSGRGSISRPQPARAGGMICRSRRHAGAACRGNRFHRGVAFA